jgi:signal transduction histidine kinase
VRTRHDEVSCYVMVFEDQTKMRESESVLRESRDRAEAGDRAKSQFLPTMSHEVRTPLNGILGFTNLLLETPLSAEQHECMETIRSSGEALIQLTDDILDFARIESGNLKLDLKPCDPCESVEEALDLLATNAGSKRVELLHWIDESLPEHVLTDPGRLVRC